MLPQARVPYPIPQQRHSGKPVTRQGHEYGSAHHNVVDVERIRQGTDVRTTVSIWYPLDFVKLICLVDHAAQHSEQN